MGKGKEYEKLVALVESTLQDYDYIKVLHDVTLKDNDGNPCQIDVLIEVDLGNRLGKSRIAIECKDKETRKVERQEMGAFIDMIKSLNISKGIYVSRLGFQKGARVKAEKSNMVQLYTLNNLSRDKITEWIDYGPLTKYGILPLWTTLNLSIESEDSGIDSIKPELLASNSTYFSHEGSKFSFGEYLVMEHDHFLRQQGKSIIFKTYAKYGCKMNGLIINVSKISEFDNELELNIDDRNFKIKSIKIAYKSRLKVEKSIDHKLQEYKKFQSESNEVEIFTATFLNQKVNLIKRSNDDEPFGYVETKGQTGLKKIVKLGKLRFTSEEE